MHRPEPADVASSRPFLETEMPWFRPILLIKIVSAAFEIFQKKDGKNTFFMLDYNT